MDKTRRFPLLVPLSLLVICVLAYGVLIPALGFYWDDFPYIWINHLFGPAGYPAFVSSDRPHSAWIFMGLTALLGEKPLGYQLASLLLYWLCAVLFWRLIRLVWRRHEKQALWAALLFAVYPGFLGHPNALIYNHHFAAMALSLFSFIAMVCALRLDGKRGWWWHIPAVLALALSQFTLEYYIGWEAARIAVAWFVLGQGAPAVKKRLRQSLWALLPYWLATLGFLAWRVFVLGFPTYQPFGGEGGGVISKSWLLSVLAEILDAVVLAWCYLIPPIGERGYVWVFWLLYAVLMSATAAITLVFLTMYKDKTERETVEREEHHEPFGLPALLVAAIGILFASVPFWLAGLPVRIDHPFFSRFTLAFIPWAALLFSTLLHFLSRIRLCGKRFLQALLVAVLVGGSVGWHLVNANDYQNDWVEMQRYFQQLVRRVPDLEPGTTLIVNDMTSLKLYSDNSLTAPLNWTYSPDKDSADMDYMMYYLSVRLGNGLPALEPGLPIEQDYRSLHFSGSTDKLLVVYYQPPGCLRVLDASQLNSIPESFPEAMLPALPLSNLSLIQTDTAERATPPEHIFGLPETANWCFYFQEADLAAQRGDWAAVADVGDAALAGEDESNEVTEYMVFIEGYLRTGRLDDALALSRYLDERAPGRFDERICTLWRGIARENPGLFEGGFQMARIEEWFCASD